MTVSDARQARVSIAVGQKDGFNRHVGAQHDLRNIVKKLDGIRVNGGHGVELENDRTDKDKGQIASGNVESRREIRQRPALYCVVYKQLHVKRNGEKKMGPRSIGETHATMRDVKDDNMGIKNKATKDQRHSAVVLLFPSRRRLSSCKIRS